MKPRRIRIEHAYDGSDFHGWQWQVGRRTVQGVLEQVLTRLAGGGAVRLRAAGRTDAGVHAAGQVADGVIRSRLDDRQLARALAKMLPRDLRPRSVRTVDDGFNAMKHATRKTYVYRVDRSPYGDPLTARFALHHPHPFDEARVREGLARLTGRRDFSGFADSRCVVEDRVRTLTVARLEQDGPRAGFRFTADGFLTYMVRNMVGTLLALGAGRIPPEQIDRILDSGDRRLAAATAPARGLCLEHVVYPPSDGSEPASDAAECE